MSESTDIPQAPEPANTPESEPSASPTKRRRSRGGRRRSGRGRQAGAEQAAGTPQSPSGDTTARESVAAGASTGSVSAAQATAPRTGASSPNRGASSGDGARPPRRRRGRGRGAGAQADQKVADTAPVRCTPRLLGPPPQVDLPHFAALGLDATLLAGVAEAGYEVPTPIQEQAIPRALAGRDIVGCAQTGTGKTAAFVLPILQRMSAPLAADGLVGRPSALVVTPTRELCGQIEEVGQRLGTYAGRQIVAAFGGVPYEPQAKLVRQGVDLLVATPGRLLDMLRQGHVSLERVETLVLDEADRMLDMGFWPDVKRIIDAVSDKRQNLLFSATMSKPVLSIIEDTLHEPIFIELGGSARPVEAVEQRILPVNSEQKVDLLVEYFRHHDPTRTIVFTRTRRRAERLAVTLNRAGITCEAIHGDRTQAQRQRALDSFKLGSTAVLVATDVVARGIDVDNITHVINYDIPTNPEDYVHRIGRTARAGSSGIAVSLLTGEEVHELKAIERLIGTTIERHDLPGFDYEKRQIPESHQVQPKVGKLVWNGGARRSAVQGIRRRPPRRSAAR